MLKIIGTNIVNRPFFTKTVHESQGNTPVSVPQRWFQKLLERLKIWLPGEVFEPKLSMFSKNRFYLTQSTYFVIAPKAVRRCWLYRSCSFSLQLKPSLYSKPFILSYILSNLCQSVSAFDLTVLQRKKFAFNSHCFGFLL